MAPVRRRPGGETNADRIRGELLVTGCCFICETDGRLET